MQQEFRADLDDGEGQGDMALKQDAIDQQRRKEVRKIIYMHFRALLCLFCICQLLGTQVA